MSRTIPERNKALVLEAFDTLFNKRDYAAAERYWSPHYIQHSAHIAPGREGLFNLVRSLPPTLKYEPGLIVAIKGLGGFQLACDAASPRAVQRLRERKRREAKPLAIMVHDLAEADRLAELTNEERALLTSIERPIVLAKKRIQDDDNPIAGLFQIAA